MANIKDPEKKRQGVFVKLPPDVIKFLREKKDTLGSQSNIIINALKKTHKELRK